MASLSLSPQRLSFPFAHKVFYNLKGGEKRWRVQNHARRQRSLPLRLPARCLVINGQVLGRRPLPLPLFPKQESASDSTLASAAHRVILGAPSFIVSKPQNPLGHYGQCWHDLDECLALSCLLMSERRYFHRWSAAASPRLYPIVRGASSSLPLHTDTVGASVYS